MLRFYALMLRHTAVPANASSCCLANLNIFVTNTQITINLNYDSRLSPFSYWSETGNTKLWKIPSSISYNPW